MIVGNLLFCNVGNQFKWKMLAGEMKPACSQVGLLTTHNPLSPKLDWRCAPPSFSYTSSILGLPHPPTDRLSFCFVLFCFL